MDFLIRPQQLEGQIKKFLTTMKERGYSETTLKSYRSFLRKACSFVEQNGALNYTKEYSEMFLTDILSELPLSESYKKHTRTAVRRFNEYVFDSSYAYRQPKGGIEPPAVFRKILGCYLIEMEDRGLKPVTIDCRRIFAAQFLNSIEEQGVNSIEDITASHVGTAVLCAGSMEGICEKLPYFLKYLYCSGLTKEDLSKAVPPFLPDRKLPTVYKKEELRNALESIDCDSLIGKRDYAILLMLATYGIRATDLVCLKVGDIDFQHDCFSFIQSKTGNEYRAALLPAVKKALLSYLAEVASVHSQSPLFRRVLAPCSALSRSAVWSIVASRLKCDIPETPRKTASAYTPYIFGESEWRRMIQEADNLSCALKVSGSDMPIAFPMIIRLLYACGLRLSEALSLKSGDIDFDRGCLIIRKAKRNRQRLVPMKQSTADLLMKYCIRRGLLQEPEAHLFAGTDGKPYSNSWVERWFAVVLKLSGIKQERCYPGERGICPHCLRHTFVFRSFQSSGDSFDGTVPFLSTYLGHENIMETDRYLRFSYELYSEAQEKISDYTRGLFPEVKV